MGPSVTERGRVKVAVLGSGDVVANLVHKLSTKPGSMELTLASEGFRESGACLREGDSRTGSGYDAIKAVLDDPEIKIVFKAACPEGRQPPSGIFEGTGKVVIDLTPKAVGPYVVPAVNPTEHLDEDNLGLLTSGAQAVVPMAHAVSQVASVLYAEAVSTVASAAAGPEMRRNIERVTSVTARGLEWVGGAEIGKALVTISPSEPPIAMRNKVYVVPEGDFDESEILESITSMVPEVQRYVPGYRLKDEPVIDYRTTPWGTRRVVSLLCEVGAAGGSLPEHAGNLDIMSAVACEVGERLARRLLATGRVS